MMLLQRKIFHLIIITLFLQISLTACYRDCQRYYEGFIEYNVSSITVKEYDAGTDELLDEDAAYDIDYTQYGSTGTQTQPIVDIIGSELEFEGTISSTTDISIDLTIGDKFNDLEIGNTINDSSGDYLTLDSFYLPLDIEGIKYESEDAVTISYSANGHQATVRKYPYTVNEEGEKTYYNTLEAVVVFDNVIVSDRYMSDFVMCRD